MNMMEALTNSITVADCAAVFWLFASWVGIGWLTEHPPRSRPSVSVLMKDYRREWMRQFVTRSPRIFDGNILATLREGTAFFASACMLALGGGLAMIGKTDQLAGFAEQFDMANVPTTIWEMKIVVVLFFVANALLRFIWSHRLFGYCAILMAAVPNDIDDPHVYARANQAAEINISAARGFNSGLRCVYFSLAAIGWLAGPIGLFLSTTTVLAITVRREFASHSRQVIRHTRP